VDEPHAAAGYRAAI